MRRKVVAEPYRQAVNSAPERTAARWNVEARWRQPDDEIRRAARLIERTLEAREIGRRHLTSCTGQAFTRDGRDQRTAQVRHDDAHELGEGRLRAHRVRATWSSSAPDWHQIISCTIWN